MAVTRKLEVPGLRLFHPPDADVEEDVVETRRYRVRRLHVKGPWLTSEAEPGMGTRADVRILIFEDPAGGPVGDAVAEGRIRPLPGRYDLVPGTLGGLEATLREPVDVGNIPRAAYVAGEKRFFFVEWKGPAGPILDTLELDP